MVEKVRGAGRARCRLRWAMRVLRVCQGQKKGRLDGSRVVKCVRTKVVVLVILANREAVAPRGNKKGWEWRKECAPHVIQTSAAQGKERLEVARPALPTALL